MPKSPGLSGSTLINDDSAADNFSKPDVPKSASEVVIHAADLPPHSIDPVTDYQKIAASLSEMYDHQKMHRPRDFKIWNDKAAVDRWKLYGHLDDQQLLALAVYETSLHADFYICEDSAAHDAGGMVGATSFATASNAQLSAALLELYRCQVNLRRQQEEEWNPTYLRSTTDIMPHILGDHDDETLKRHTEQLMSVHRSVHSSKTAKLHEAMWTAATLRCASASEVIPVLDSLAAAVDGLDEELKSKLHDQFTELNCRLEGIETARRTIPIWSDPGCKDTPDNVAAMLQAGGPRGDTDYQYV